MWIGSLAMVLVFALLIGIVVFAFLPDPHPHRGQHCVTRDLVYHSAKAGGPQWECVKWEKNS
jgi:uncharacterized membrane protein